MLTKLDRSEKSSTNTTESSMRSTKLRWRSPFRQSVQVKAITAPVVLEAETTDITPASGADVFSWHGKMCTRSLSKKLEFAGWI
jgi:hypothetical protein